MKGKKKLRVVFFYLKKKPLELGISKFHERNKWALTYINAPCLQSVILDIMQILPK